jgi:hypothetical protein
VGPTQFSFSHWCEIRAASRGDMPFRLNASRPRSVDDPCVGASGVHEHHASCVDTLHAQETLPVALWLCVSALLDSLMLLRVQELLVSTVSTLPVAAVLMLHASLLPADTGPHFERRSSPYRCGLSLPTLGRHRIWLAWGPPSQHLLL